MAKIQVLEKHIAELIAAGEVVDRPASVVKELVENSIDAGASAVTVEIKNGGVTFLRVTDNGCGMEQEDVPTAFLRHATSKVRKEDDLAEIGTLGFRGEALASVAAVAEVELFTRTQQQVAGVHYVIAGGEEQCLEEAGCAQGTTIVVRDLFYNTPARMKFLKTDAAETKAVAAILDNLALSHPEVSFRFVRDGREDLHTPGDNKLKSTVYSVFGKEFTGGLIPVEYELEHVRVWGFVSKPSAARPNRSMQQFFINGRCVKSRTAMAALEQAFKGSLMVGKFPACVLHLHISCEAVDVNVHPAKLEVRFMNERPIFDAVYHGVKTALNQGDTPVVMVFPQTERKNPFSAEGEKQTGPAKQLQFRPSGPAIPQISPQQKAPRQEQADAIQDIPLSPRFDPRSVNPVFGGEAARPAILQDSGRRGVQKEMVPPSSMQEPTNPSSIQAQIQQTVEPDEQTAGPFLEAVPETPHVVGEAFGTYIIIERNQDELLFIDKHAAHERMLYEQLKEQRGEESAQMLLEPVTVTLNKLEYASVLGALDVFAQAGFELEDFGGGTILVRSAPLSLDGSDIGEAVMEMAGYLHGAKTDLTTEHLDWLYHNIACRAAIKAGDDSKEEELIALAQRLERNPEIRYCPHGRPVSIVMKRKDLEKQFGRTQS